MPVYVTRTGGSLHFEGSKRSTVLTDQHNAPGIAVYCSKAYDAVFLGKVHGTPPDGFKHLDTPVPPDFKVGGTREKGRRQWEIGLKAAEELAAHFNVDGEPYVWIDIIAGRSSRAIVDWAWDDLSTCRDSCARNTGIAYIVAHALKSIRVMICTDYRLFPRSAEFVRDPGLRPAVCLSQGSWQHDCTQYGVKYSISFEHAGVENWFSADPRWIAKPKLNDGEHGIYVGHPHLNGASGWNTRGRLDALQRLAALRPGWRALGDPGEWSIVFGDEWPDRHLGCVEPWNLEAKLEQLASPAGYMLPPDGDFLTSKLRKYCMWGMCPQVWDASPWRYDPEYTTVPQRSCARIPSEDASAEPSRQELEDTRQALLIATQPNFSALDKCVESCYNGSLTRESNSRGYRIR